MGKLLYAGRIASSSLFYGREWLHRFRRDDSGGYVIIVALAMPVLVGIAAFGVEQGVLVHKQKVMQHAADSAAVTAAVAITAGATDNGAVQAKAVAANYGFRSGIGVTNSAAVAVNAPPTSGPNIGNRWAIEVIISQPQTRLFSSIWGSADYPVTARAV